MRKLNRLSNNIVDISKVLQMSKESWKTKGYKQNSTQLNKIARLP